MKKLSILNWNIEWAKPDSKRGKIIKKKINELSPDIICLTETYHDFLKESGYTILSHADYGYKNTDGKHKVMLWSKNVWKDVSTMEKNNLPNGRFISGKTKTPIGELNILGVCIPWKDAHVSTGHKNRKSWEEHLNYLKGLQSILKDDSFSANTIIVGDFNQRIPRKYSPAKVYDELLKTFKNLKMITGGNIDKIDKQTIDHICCSDDLDGQNVFDINNVENELKLSDHFGIFAVLDGVYTESHFKNFVNQFSWIFAKTYANKAPHEYIVLNKVGNEHKDEFIKIAQFIREKGFKAFYYTREGYYYKLDKNYYWTMDDKVEDTDLINRAKIADYDLVNNTWKWKGNQ